ncbi:MAG: 4a-hydroxytetrahydrobiopterin dehydratase [Armatimonadota bacterium]
MELTQQKCVPCEVGTKPLARDEAEKLLAEAPQWTLQEDAKAITREFKLKDFRAAIDFVNKVAEIAEAEGHHPDIFIYYNKVKLTHSTHKIGGLSLNDFILAAKIDRVI